MSDDAYMAYDECSDIELVDALNALADGGTDDLGQLLTEAASRILAKAFPPGTPVTFTYHHGETVAGVVSSSNHKTVFVNFGKPQNEGCDPERLTRL